MPTEDAYSSGHLVLSHFGACKCSNVETNISWTCLVSGLLSFEHPSVLLFLLSVWFCMDRPILVRHDDIITPLLELEHVGFFDALKYPRKRCHLLEVPERGQMLGGWSRMISFLTHLVKVMFLWWASLLIQLNIWSTSSLVWPTIRKVIFTWKTT